MPHTDKLKFVHAALLDEMADLQNKLPADVEDISESFERYARVVSLLVRSLETLLRLSNQQSADETSGNRQSVQTLLADIEHRLARIAEDGTATEISSKPQ